MSQFQNQRQRDIFEVVVRDYIRTGQPVGSKNLAEFYRLNLSPASIRKVLAELEGLGLLSRAHASAGRAPTDEGFKVYVDGILTVAPAWPLATTGALSGPTKPGSAPLASAMITAAIKRALSGPDAEPGPHFKFLARLLTELTSHVGLVMAPRDDSTRLKKIHFFRLDQARLLTVLVSEHGVIHNKVISPAEDYSQDELNQVNVYLESFEAPFSLAEIKAKLLSTMAEEKNRFEEIFKRVFTLTTEAEVAVDKEVSGDSDFYIDAEGQGRLLENPDFKDVEAMKSLFWAFTNHKRLIELLNEITGDSRVRVVIGPSGSGEDGLALVASPYRGGPGVSGALGVLGPRRLNYSEIVPMVDYAAQAVSGLFSK